MSWEVNGADVLEFCVVVTLLGTVLSTFSIEEREGWEEVKRLEIYLVISLANSCLESA